jgi:hypothetical protein
VSVESEMEPAFAGLHQPCAPVLGNLVCLPGPQRDALGVVLISQSRNRHGRVAAPQDPRLITGHRSEQAIFPGKGDFQEKGNHRWLYPPRGTPR